MHRVLTLLALLLVAAGPAAPGEESTFRVGAAVGPSTRALVISDGSETIAIIDLETDCPSGSKLPAQPTQYSSSTSSPGSATGGVRPSAHASR